MAESPISDLYAVVTTSRFRASRRQNLQVTAKSEQVLTSAGTLKAKLSLLYALNSEKFLTPAGLLYILGSHGADTGNFG
jgi:hypothetical protein